MLFLNWIWNLLGVPVNLVLWFFGARLTPEWHTFARIGVLIALLYTVSRVSTRLRKTFRRLLKRDKLLTEEELEALGPRGTGTVSPIGPGSHLASAVAQLKYRKDFAGVAEAYVSAGLFREAAKWFKKARDRKRAAECLAKVGRTRQAARLLLREGEFGLAAQLFSMRGRHSRAGRAYERAGNFASAAAAYTQARQFGNAAKAYRELFAREDAIADAPSAAQACLNLLTDDKTKTRIDRDDWNALMPLLGAQFERDRQYETAARLYRDAGDLVKAGEAFVLAGQLEAAVQCLKEAGNEKEAARISGRLFENKSQWADAGRAYQAAGAFLQAGECFAKANSSMQAAQCFEQAGAHYRAGLAYAHAGKFEETIRCLQKIKERDPDFDLSRALLGRAFYELRDYAHCAAALSNHLTGKRVESQNIEYFYMLALAYEQMGKLDESRDLLLKIRTVNAGNRDVTTRLSNISSRISMLKSESPPVVHPASTEKSESPPTVMQAAQANIGGRYKLEKELGRGGMGVVYLAHDTQLDRPVALKFLGDFIDHSDEFRQRFTREARTAARIAHPNIISIYDINSSRGKAYIAMEYVEGGSLYRYIRTKGKLSPRETANIFVQVCSALAAIHEAGIVHRDIKPDNILIAKGGLVKITDFGLAKAEDVRLTRTGALMGTPSYMAPEQVLGKETDPRSDIYSLGLVLHECLTGKTVFTGEDVLEKQLNETPKPPSAFTDGIPEALDRIVMNCVAKKPEARYQTARALMDDLRRI